jgi:hypothetical protein
MMISDEALKPSTNCGQWLPHSEYHKMRAATDGLQVRCKTCAKRAVKTSRAKSDTLHGSYRLRYNAEHQEELAAYGRDYRYKNRILIRLKRQITYLKQRLAEVATNAAEPSALRPSDAETRLLVNAVAARVQTGQ